MGAGASSAKKDLGTCDKSGKKLASSEFIGPEFDVTMLSPKIPGLEAGTPYRLRIAYEALVVVEPTEGSAPLCHFKYQDILCWGHGKKTFQFKVFGNLFGQERSEYVTIRFETSHGKSLEEVTLSTVRSLMADMEKQAVSKDDFKALVTSLHELEAGCPEWMDMVKQFCEGRVYIANQGSKLLQELGPECEFEKIELACFLYGHILNKDSFQLLLNEFGDSEARENVLHRLGIAPGQYSTSAPSQKVLQLSCPGDEKMERARAPPGDAAGATAEAQTL